MIRDLDSDGEINSLLYRKPVPPDLGAGVVVTFSPGPNETFRAHVVDGWTRETTTRGAHTGYPDALKAAVGAWRRTRKTLAQKDDV